MARTPFYDSPMSREVRTRLTDEQRALVGAGVKLLQREEAKVARKAKRAARSVGDSVLVRYALDYLFEHEPRFKALAKKMGGKR